MSCGALAYTRSRGIVWGMFLFRHPKSRQIGEASRLWKHSISELVALLGRGSEVRCRQCLLAFSGVGGSVDIVDRQASEEKPEQGGEDEVHGT